MVPVARLAEIPFFEGLPADELRRLADVATERELDRNQIVLHQHDDARSLFVLLSGSVQFLLRFEGVHDLLVGTESRPGALLGWSAFRPPYRNTASVRCEIPCLVLEVPREAFSEMFGRSPRQGYILLRRVAVVLANRLEQAKSMLVAGNSS